MSAHTFNTHERAAPTSEACLTAPNRGVSVIPGTPFKGMNLGQSKMAQVVQTMQRIKTRDAIHDNERWYVLRLWPTSCS